MSLYKKGRKFRNDVIGTVPCNWMAELRGGQRSMRPVLQPPPPLARMIVRDGSAAAPANDVAAAGVMSLAGGGEDPVEQRDDDGHQSRDQQVGEPAAGATPAV